MQNFDLRQAIIYRIQDNSPEDLRDTINSSIHGDEKVLPGLGVLFEMIWENSEADTQQQLVQSLYNHLQSDSNHATASPSY